MEAATFVVGEEIYSQGISGEGITMKVVELLENDGLRVKLTEVNWYWAKQGVIVDSEHVLVKRTVYDFTVWNFKDNSLPHFHLKVAPNGFRIFRNN